MCLTARRNVEREIVGCSKSARKAADYKRPETIATDDSPERVRKRMSAGIRRQTDK